jgi:hypothetical protein
MKKLAYIGIVDAKEIIQSYYKKVETLELINDIAKNMNLKEEFTNFYKKIALQLRNCTPFMHGR